MSDFERFKESVKKYSNIQKRICEKSLVFSKPSRFPPEHRGRKPFFGKFERCFKPYAGLPCQAPVGAVTYCMAETPCWRGDGGEPEK